MKAAALLTLLLVPLGGCRPRPVETARPVRPPRFEDVAHRAGLRFVHDNGARTGKLRFIESNPAGCALFERTVYDEDGNLLTGSFMDYLCPTAPDQPPLRSGHRETPSPYTAYGIKGAGEGGRMLTPAIMSAAIEDALSPYAVTVTSLPIRAEQIVEWVARATGR